MKMLISGQWVDSSDGQTLDCGTSKLFMNRRSTCLRNPRNAKNLQRRFPRRRRPLPYASCAMRFISADPEFPESPVLPVPGNPSGNPE